jgi:hypothetical protein
MGSGIRLRKLWGLRAGVIVSLLAASIVAVWSVNKVSLVPLGLTPRSLEMATASTHVVVDTPTSALVDLRQDTYSLEGLRNRSVLLGNVIAGTRVRRNIARRLGLPADAVRIQAPLTREQSAPSVTSESARHTSDILKSAHQYRRNIQANLTVPMLDIYSQAPTAAAASTLVNAAVDELRAYLAELAAAEDTPTRSKIQLMQLGRGEGVVINEGVDWQVALLAFLVTFGACAATVIFIDRVRAGWQVAARSEPGSAT